MAPERGGVGQGGGVALSRLHVHPQETLSYVRGLHLGFSLGNHEETSKAPSREGASNCRATQKALTPDYNVLPFSPVPSAWARFPFYTHSIEMAEWIVPKESCSKIRWRVTMNLKQ